MLIPAMVQSLQELREKLFALELMWLMPKRSLNYLLRQLIFTFQAEHDHACRELFHKRDDLPA